MLHHRKFISRSAIVALAVIPAACGDGRSSPTGIVVPPELTGIVPALQPTVVAEWVCHDHGDDPPDDGGPGDGDGPPMVTGVPDDGPEDGPPMMMEPIVLLEWYCHWDGPGDGGGGGDGSGGGGGGSGEPEDPFASRGSLWHDELPGYAEGVPNCSTVTREENIREWVWCFASAAPDSLEFWFLEDTFSQIVQRCPHLADDWQRAKENLRLFKETVVSDSFGGTARPHDDWMLLSYGWFNSDRELGLAHELIHLDGSSHAGPVGSPERHDFANKERECSGGRSVIDPGQLP